MTPEKKVQNEIIKLLKSKDLFFERRQAGGFSYKKGIPDLYAVVKGQHLEIEVKKPGGKLSPMQEKFRDMCSAKNILWICVENITQLEILLNALI